MRGITTLTLFFLLFKKGTKQQSKIIGLDKVYGGYKMGLEHQIILFERGIKPAVLVSGFKSLRRQTDTKQAQRNTERLKNYPYIDFHHRGNRLYFQNNLSRDAFLGIGTYTISIKGVRYVDFKQWYLGIALGFPPSAVTFFCETPDIVWKDVPKTLINYYGIEFTCHREDIENCLLWCNTHYFIPHDLKQSLPYSIEDFVHKQSTTTN